MVNASTVVHYMKILRVRKAEYTCIISFNAQPCEVQRHRKLNICKSCLMYSSVVFLFFICFWGVVSAPNLRI